MNVAEVKIKNGIFLSFKDSNSAEELMKELLEEFKKKSGNQFEYYFGEHIEKRANGESKVKFAVVIGKFDLPLFAKFYEQVSKQNKQFGNLEVGLLHSLISMCGEATEGTSILLEQVLPVNISKNDIKEAFKREIDKIQDVKDTKVLVITDPYLLKGNNDYVTFLKEFLTSLISMIPNLKKLVLIIPDEYFCNAVYNNVKKYLENKFSNLVIRRLDWKSNSEFHDRLFIFFIDNKTCKTIVLGTSLNGIGKRIAILLPLPEKDNREIANIISSNYPECFADVFNNS